MRVYTVINKSLSVLPEAVGPNNRAFHGFSAKWHAHNKWDFIRKQQLNAFPSLQQAKGPEGITL